MKLRFNRPWPLFALLFFLATMAISCGQYRSRDFMRGCVGECGELFENARTVSRLDPQTSCGAQRCSVLLRITGELCPNTSAEFVLSSNGSLVFTRSYTLDESINRPVHIEVIFSEARVGDILGVTVRPVPNESPTQCKRLGNFNFELDLYRF